MSLQSDIKAVQKQLIEQLTQQILSGAGPPIRSLLARCIAQVLSLICFRSLLYEIIYYFCEILIEIVNLMYKVCITCIIYFPVCYFIL